MKEKKCKKLRLRKTQELLKIKGDLEQKITHSGFTPSKLKPKAKKWRSDHTGSAFYRHVCNELKSRNGSGDNIGVF